MRRVTLLAGVAAAALLALCVWGCFGLARHLIVALDRWGDAGAGITQTAAKLNGEHGTIAMADEDLGAAKSLFIHADLVARHEQQQLVVWDARGEQIFSNIDGGITDLRKTIRQTGDAADAFSGTADAGTKLMDDLRKQANDRDHGVGATMANVNGAVSDARSLTPDARRIVKAAAGTSEHVEGIAGDGQKIADHYEKAIDNPKKVPLWLRVLPTGVRMAVQAYLEHLALK